jgi:hypothetical protein
MEVGFGQLRHACMYAGEGSTVHLIVGCWCPGSIESTSLSAMVLSTLPPKLYST